MGAARAGDVRCHDPPRRNRADGMRRDQRLRLPSRQSSSWRHQAREADGNFVPNLLAELTAKDAIATYREALDRRGCGDSWGWLVYCTCSEHRPGSGTISYWIFRYSGYVIPQYYWAMETLISPWSGVQLSPLAPDHALLAAACPATRKSAPSRGRSVCKTAARPERRVFRGCEGVERPEPAGFKAYYRSRGPIHASRGWRVPCLLVSEVRLRRAVWRAFA